MGRAGIAGKFRRLPSASCTDADWALESSETWQPTTDVTGNRPAIRLRNLGELGISRTVSISEPCGDIGPERKAVSPLVASIAKESA